MRQEELVPGLNLLWYDLFYCNRAYTVRVIQQGTPPVFNVYFEGPDMDAREGVIAAGPADFAAFASLDDALEQVELFLRQKHKSIPE